MSEWKIRKDTVAQQIKMSQNKEQLRETNKAKQKTMKITLTCLDGKKDFSSMLFSSKK